MGGKRGPGSRNAKAKARMKARIAAKTGGFKAARNTGVRGDYKAGFRGFSVGASGGYSGGNIADPASPSYGQGTASEMAAARTYLNKYGTPAQKAAVQDQIPGTAEYAQRIRREEAKEKVTKTESGFGETFKKAMAITGFLTAPGIVSGLNLANTLKKKDTDYSKAFAPGQSIADKYGAWSPQNLSRFYGETMDPGDWNMASIDPYAGVRPENEAYRNWLKQQEQRESWEMRAPIGVELEKANIWNQTPDLQIATHDKPLWGAAPPATGPAADEPGSDVSKSALSPTQPRQFHPFQEKAMNTWGVGGDTLVSWSPGSYLNIGSQAPTRTEGYSDKNLSVYNSNPGFEQAVASLRAENPAMAKASDRNWSRGLGTDTRAVRSADIRSRGGGARSLPTLASQAPALKAVQDQQAQAGNLTISDYLKQAQEQSAQNRAALSQLQTGRTDLTAQIEALKKQYGEDVDLTGLQKQSGEFQTAIDQRTADLSAYDQAVRGNVVRQQQMWATPQRTWGVKARTSEYKSPLQQFGRKARQETKKIQTQTPTISNLAATWGNLPVLNI